MSTAAGNQAFKITNMVVNNGLAYFFAEKVIWKVQNFTKRFISVQIQNIHFDSRNRQESATSLFPSSGGLPNVNMV